VNEKLKVAIQQWQATHALAKRNTDLLLSTTYTKENVELAQTRMRDVSIAERALLTAMNGVDQSEIPPPLLEWRVTSLGVGTESACRDCWFSSVIQNKHPECVARIKRFFNAQDAIELL
jgi:hypothetical protein